MLRAADEDEEEDKVGRILTSRGLALVGLGISISLDELAIGFSIGLVRLPVSAVIVAIGLQAFVAAQLGLAIGARIAERWRERAKQVAGIALILLGADLVAEQLIR
jgi:manganese efflux pump family protein